MGKTNNNNNRNKTDYVLGMMPNAFRLLHLLQEPLQPH